MISTMTQGKPSIRVTVVLQNQMAEWRMEKNNAKPGVCGGGGVAKRGIPRNMPPSRRHNGYVVTPLLLLGTTVFTVSFTTT
jgi:hypothetical protein